MRIGITTSVVQRGRTGIAQYLFGLVRALLAERSGHQFVLFVLEEDLPLFAFARQQVQLVPVSEAYRPALKNIAWHQGVLPWLARKHRLDVLHVPSYRRLLWARPCAMVATIHDLAPCRLAGKYDSLRQLYGRVVARQLAGRQDEIIAVSQNTANDIRAFYGLPPERLTLVYNGLNHERFHPGNPEKARAEARQRYGLERPFFLYLARLEHPGKNHVRLITAFNEFKAATGSDWLLALAGSDWHGAETIHEACRQSPYAADIRCIGFVPDEHVPELYRAAQAMTYPSLYEGFGMPPTEAMACECPVVSSTGGALGEVVGSGGILLSPEDIPAWKDALIRLACEPEWREQWRRAGLARARQFEWRRAAVETLAVYQRARRRARRRQGWITAPQPSPELAALS